MSTWSWPDNITLNFLNYQRTSVKEKLLWHSLNADELGRIFFDKEDWELLFTHLSLRAGRKSTIVTTNLSFDRWEEIFSDRVMTTTMIDRLTYISYLLNMNGGSYRLKEVKEWLAKQEEEKDGLNWIILL